MLNIVFSDSTPRYTLNRNAHINVHQNADWNVCSSTIHNSQSQNQAVSSGTASLGLAQVTYLFTQ